MASLGIATTRIAGRSQAIRKLRIWRPARFAITVASPLLREQLDLLDVELLSRQDSSISQVGELLEFIGD